MLKPENFDVETIEPSGITNCDFSGVQRGANGATAPGIQGRGAS